MLMQLRTRHPNQIIVTLTLYESSSVVPSFFSQPVPSLVSHRDTPFPEWSVLFTTSGTIPPPAPACARLADLYSQILDNTLNIWASHTKFIQVALEAGDVRLEFGSSKVPVPWRFFAAFADSERDAVGRRFARTWLW